MKSLLIIACLVLLSFSALTQTISGLVKDNQNEPVSGATIRLLKATDSTIFQTKAARDNGKFEFSRLTNGIYILAITAVGNKKYFSGPLTIDDTHSNILLPVIMLIPAKKTELKEAVVTAKKPLIEQDLDKTIVNVEAMISSATSNTLEVLEKTPGVTVDVNGEISLNGRSGVMVLIEGRPTHMSGEDLAAYLKSLPGSALDKIELMSNPPAKYDAGGSAVINIRLKRNRTQGYTGNIAVSYSQGIVGRNYNSLNLNYLKRKVNLFGNFGYSKNAYDDEDVYDREYFNNNNEKRASVNLKNYDRNSSNEFTGRAGMDYTLSSKTTLGFIAAMNSRVKDDRQYYVGNNYNGNDILDSTGTGNLDSRYTWRQVSANLNIQHKFDNEGTELSADLNYINYHTGGDQALANFVNASSGTSIGSDSFLYRLPANINIYTARADYSLPLKNKVKMTAGIKSSVVNNDNQSDYFTITGNTSNVDFGKSNHFIYRENINAAYVNSRKDWKRSGVQLGLRLENTQSKGHQLGNAVVAESSFNRNYTGLFPTVFVSHKLDSAGKHTLSLNYSRRINRPGYQQLNPFLFFRDQYSYSAGNPYLNPSYNNFAELSYRYRQYLGVSLQYDRTADVYFSATQAKETYFITRPENIAGGYMVAMLINLNLPPAKWWSLNLNMGGAHFVTKGKIYTESLDLDIYACRINLLNQFKFKHDWSGELSGNYISRLIAWQRIIEPRYRFNAAIQKKIWKGKGNIKVSMEDIGHLMKQREQTISLKQATSYRVNIQDSQRVGLSFSYSFGKETFARKRRYNDNGADDVKGRVE